RRRAPAHPSSSPIADRRARCRGARRLRSLAQAITFPSVSPPVFTGAQSDRSPSGRPPAVATRVLAVSSNKGGVGKTTLATNLAIYLRALHEDLPILILSLDDQGIIERMFG